MCLHLRLKPNPTQVQFHEPFLACLTVYVLFLEPSTTKVSSRVSSGPLSGLYVDVHWTSSRVVPSGTSIQGWLPATT